MKFFIVRDEENIVTQQKPTALNRLRMLRANYTQSKYLSNVALLKYIILCVNTVWFGQVHDDLSGIVYLCIANDIVLCKYLKELVIHLRKVYPQDKYNSTRHLSEVTTQLPHHHIYFHQHISLKCFTQGTLN